MGSGRGGGAGKTRSGFASRTNKGSASGPNKHQHLVPKPLPSKRKPFKAPNIFAEKRDDPTPSIPVELQQTLLDFYVKAFPELLNAASVDETLLPIVQEVKGRLFERDFAQAFGKREFLEAYASRWSAGRTVGYVDVFTEVLRHVKLGSASMKPKQAERAEAAGDGDSDEDEDSDQDSSAGGESEEDRESVTKHDQVKFICLGGGAGAELVALAGVHRLVRDLQAEKEEEDDDDDEEDMPNLQQLRLNKSRPALPVIDLDTVLVDISDWSPVTNSLKTTITSPPQLSAYASASAKAAARPFASPESFATEFVQQDVLDTDFDIATLLPEISVQQPVIITLMFTLNELYSTSLASTQRFLLSLTAAAPLGALLLIVDSPGSYSTVTLNNSEKQYPMLWLLEHTLFNTAPKSFHAQALAAAEAEDKDEADSSEKQKKNVRFEEDIAPLWERVKSEESKWCRLPEELKYPIELEDMRYQMHLYRRL